MTSKSKILMLCDHPLSTSGVGTQARWLINGLLGTGKFSFRVFGAAIKHENYDTVVVNPDFIIKPTNGFGDKITLRTVLAQEKPDALLLFTDPRFFLWVWEMEDEIHEVCPITYNHLWDNPPWPEYNRVLYDSTDLINCINWPTYEMVHERFPERTNYVPHAVPANVFFPLEEDNRNQIKKSILGPERADHFISLFVGRNARRKLPSDIIASFRIFLDNLQEKHGHKKATLLMHCDPGDPEGPNFHHVIDLLKLKDNVIFSKDRIGYPEMNALYNISDTLINVSLNEGFGVPVLEAKMCEKPVIAIKTGGLTRQVEDHETGFQYGVGLEPEVRMLVGNQQVPYIYEDAVSHNTIAAAYMKIYEMGPDERKRVGKLAREHSLKNYNVENLVKDWDLTLTQTIDDWKRGVMPNSKRWSCKEL